MPFLKVKLYKYPIFLVFLAFWAGIFLYPYGWYSIIGFVFGLILLRYILGSDIVYPLLFFLSGFLYMQSKDKIEPSDSTVAIRATVTGRGMVKVDSIIGGQYLFYKGRTIRIRGLSGFERGDIIEALVKIRNKRQFMEGTIIKIQKRGESANLIIKLHRYLKEKIEELSDNEEVQGFMLGVLIGYRDFIHSSVMEDFKKTGTMHILALSGLHIGILATFIYLLFVPLTGHRNPAIIIASIIVLFYMLLVGTSPSIFRAYLILLVTVIVKIMRRRTSILNALGISGILSLALYPSWAFSYSFMLSYLAVFGIIHFSQITHNRGLQYLFISLGAVLFTMPVTAYLSGYAPVFSFLFNLIVIPLFSIILTIFFIVVILYIVFPPLLPLYSLISTTSGTLFLKFIHVLSLLSPVVKIRISDPVILTLYYLVLLVVPVIISILNKAFSKKQEVLIEGS